MRIFLVSTIKYIILIGVYVSALTLHAPNHLCSNCEVSSVVTRIHYISYGEKQNNNSNVTIISNLTDLKSISEKHTNSTKLLTSILKITFQINHYFPQQKQFVTKIHKFNGGEKLSGKILSLLRIFG